MSSRAFVSFGAGVQSTAIALLILHEPDRLLKAMGRLPEYLIFADTGAEVAGINQHVVAMAERFEQARAQDPRMPQLITVNNGSILGEVNQTSWRGINTIPLFTRNADHSAGMLRRQCTGEYKILPIERKIRELLGYRPRQRIPAKLAQLWLGISIEEAGRVAVNKSKWINNCYPLLELGWSRTKCYQYCLRHGIQPKKSRCFFCPFISDWASYKRESPEDFAKAVEVDKLVRNSTQAGVLQPAFIHRSCVPLEIAVADQLPLWWEQEDLGFLDECQGHCGV